MTHALKPYPAYRDSGLPWIGEMPKHWEVQRNGRLFTQRNETGYTDLPILEVSLRTGVRVRQFDKGARKQKMNDRSQYKRAAQGDIAYNMMRMWQGAVGVAPMDGLVSPAYVVACPFPGIDSRYYSYLFRTGDYMREIDNFSRGIVSDRNRLYWDDFKQLPAAFPPFNEQIKIADFLDDHERLTNRFIHNKERLIALLKERKQAVIDRAVTRGLDPNAPMQSTGIDWMPKVPAHWDTRKIKQVAAFNPTQAEKSVGLSDDDEVVFLPMENVSTTGSFDCSARSKIRDLRNGYTYFERNDVVVAKITPCFENGKGAHLGRLETEIGFGTTEFVVLRSQPKIEPRFLYQVTMLSSFRQGGKSAMTGAAGQQRVPLNFIREFPFGLPSIKDQCAILDVVEKEKAMLAKDIDRTERTIDLVLQYRERLISDVVTGKLDVRGVRLDTVLDADALEEAGQVPLRRAATGAAAVP